MMVFGRWNQTKRTYQSIIGITMDVTQWRLDFSTFPAHLAMENGEMANAVEQQNFLDLDILLPTDVILLLLTTWGQMHVRLLLFFCVFIFFAAFLWSFLYVLASITWNTQSERIAMLIGRNVFKCYSCWQLSCFGFAQSCVKVEV